MPSDPAAETSLPPPLPPVAPRAGLPLWWIAAAVVLSAGAAAVLVAVNPTTTRLFPPCPLHAVTGLYCPGCGSTRALHHLLHGRVAMAFGYNPLLVVSLPLIVYSLAPRLWPTAPPARPLAPWLVWALLAAVLTFGVLRNLPWEPVRWMAP